MNQPNHHQIATYLTNYALSELVKYVVEDYGCTIEEAMERVYTSRLLPALQDEESFHQCLRTWEYASLLIQSAEA